MPITVTRPCETCGHPVRAHGSYLPRWCSWTCRQAGGHRRAQVTPAPAGTRITLTCATCDGEYEVPPSKADRKYCSRACTYRSQAATLLRGLIAAGWEPARKTTADRRWRSRRDPTGARVRAHKSVARALAAGELVRPATCEECGVAPAVHGHHDDYRRELDVVWLCRSCHAATHRDERRGQWRIDGWRPGEVAA